MANTLAKHHKAVEWNEKALALYRQRSGEDSADVARLRNNLGSAWLDLGQYEKAIGYFEQALDVFKRSLGKDHPYTKNVSTHLKNANQVRLLART
jgi:tetratricopeptide (TPR) repeat protein